MFNKLIVLSIFCSSIGFAQVDPLPQFLKSHRLKELQKHGTAIAIIHKDQVIYKSVSGFKKNKKSKIDDSTLFPLASCSKPITAAYIAYLTKQKHLSPNDPISLALKEIDPRIKLRHALSHSTGYDDFKGNKAIEAGQSRDSIIQLVTQAPPEHAPGINYYYSNIFFSLVENVIQTKTQTPFEQGIRSFLSKINIEGEEICQVTHPEHLAFPHQKSKAKKLPVFYPKTVCSAGGLFLSINQMAEFMKLLLGQYPEVLSKQDLESFYQPQVEVTDIFRKWQIQWPFPVNDLKSYYTLGWRTLQYKEDVENRLVFHSGHLNGVSTFLGFLPRHAIGIVVLTNQDDIYTEGLGFDFWKIIFGLSVAHEQKGI